MELRHLRYFAAVAAEGSFSRAAARLHVTQPALSRQIRDLEEELRRPLLVRGRTRVVLTNAGRALLPEAQRLLAHAGRLAERVRGAPEETVRLRIAHSCGFDTEFIAPLLRPGEGVSVEMSEMMPGEAFAALRDDRAEAIIAVKPRARLLAGLTGRELWRIAPMAVLPAGHPLAGHASVRLRELAGERWGIWEPKRFPGYADQFVPECRRAGFRPKVARYVSSLGDIFAHVMAGDFISFAASVVRDLPHPGVTLVPLQWPRARRPIVMLLWKRGAANGALCAQLASRVAEKAAGRDG